jgi:acetoin utilization deacetylase AcuC-like enzyme
MTARNDKRWITVSDSGHPSGRWASTREVYIDAFTDMVDWLACTSRAFVLSLGYDIVAKDPHGSWDFSQVVFMEIGEVLAESGIAGVRGAGGRLFA